MKLTFTSHRNYDSNGYDTTKSVYACLSEITTRLTKQQTWNTSTK